MDNIKKYNNAIVTPTNKIGRKIYGAVYYNKCDSWNLIRSTQRSFGRNYIPNNPNIIKSNANMRIINAPALYLGHLTTHYGHYLVESLSRVWSIDKLRSNKIHFTYVVFSPWFLKRFAQDYGKFSPFTTLLAIFGLSMKNVIIVDNITKFKTLYVPESMLTYQPMSFSIIQNSVFDKMVEYCSRNCKIDNYGDKIYISRKHSMLRKIYNEDKVEELFIKRGFKIVYMEELPFIKQVAITSRAKIIAGFDGSGMHNTLFAKGADVIVLFGHRSGNGFQNTCDKLRGNNLIAIRNKVVNGRVDINYLIECLDKKI